jgi:hypothetical protein
MRSSSGPKSLRVPVEPSPSEHRLWTDGCSLLYEGRDSVSKYQSQPPAGIKQASRMTLRQGKGWRHQVAADRDSAQQASVAEMKPARESLKFKSGCVCSTDLQAHSTTMASRSSHMAWGWGCGWNRCTQSCWSGLRLGIWAEST